MNFICNTFINSILFITFISSTEEVDLNLSTVEESPEDNILCRNCGNDISSSHYIVSRQSPFSRDSFNDTLFHKKQVLIQVLSNNIFLNFAVITSIQSYCIPIEEWEEHDTWFPGYRWKPCICPACGAYVGWLFEPIKSNSESSSQFFGLILSSLVGESCKYKKSVQEILLCLLLNKAVCLCWSMLHLVMVHCGRKHILKHFNHFLNTRS